MKYRVSLSSFIWSMFFSIWVSRAPHKAFINSNIGWVIFFEAKILPPIFPGLFSYRRNALQKQYIWCPVFLRRVRLDKSGESSLLSPLFKLFQYIGKEFVVSFHPFILYLLKENFTSDGEKRYILAPMPVERCVLYYWNIKTLADCQLQTLNYLRWGAMKCPTPLRIEMLLPPHHSPLSPLLAIYLLAKTNKKFPHFTNISMTSLFLLGVQSLLSPETQSPTKSSFFSCTYVELCVHLEILWLVLFFVMYFSSRQEIGSTLDRIKLIILFTITSRLSSYLDLL